MMRLRTRNAPPWWMVIVMWIFVLGALAVAVFGADVIPVARRVTWENNVGVPGGIYQYASRTNVPINGLDTTGMTDGTTIIQNAINAASANTRLTLPAGTIRINGGIAVSKDNVTLAGASSDPSDTVLMLYGSSGVSVYGAAIDLENPGYPPNALTSQNALRGDTVLQTVDDLSNLLNTMIWVAGTNDVTIPVVSTSGYRRMRGFHAFVTGVSPSTLTLDQPLFFDVPAGARITQETIPPYHVTGSGIENLTVDASNSTTQIAAGIFYAVNSWLYNVRALEPLNYNISTLSTYKCTITHCDARGITTAHGSSRVAMLIGAATSCLFTDNILADQSAGFEINAGCTGNVFAYNFLTDLYIGNSIGAALDTNHGPHNSFNLYEGNITPRVVTDGYFGSTSNETFVGNWIHGTVAETIDPGITDNQIAMTVNRFSRQYNLVGNQFGRTGVGITWTYSNIGVGFDTTSSTSITVGTGGVSVTIGTGLLYSDNGTVALFYRTSDPTKWMTGRITSYNSGTGSATFTRYTSNGSGTFSDWTVKGGGGYGSGASTGYCMALGGPNIGNGGFFGDLTICAPQSQNVWWRCWDGTPMSLTFQTGGVIQPYGTGSTSYNSATPYVCVPGTSRAVTFLTAPGPSNMTGGESITVWIANNAAKSGLSTWDTPSASSSDWLPISPNSFQELDYDAYSTAIIKGNWNAATDSVPSNEALGGDTISTSYYLPSKPNFFGSLTWPPFSPTSPVQSFTAIPAGYRYTNGVGSEVPGYNPNDGPTASGQNLDVAGTITVTGTLTLP